MKQTVNKINNNHSGFSLVEMLLAVMILLLSSAILASNMEVIRKVYTELTQTANAQVLLSTTMTRLRDELGCAAEVYTPANTPDNKEIRYRSGGPELVIVSKIVPNPPDEDEPETIKISYVGFQSSERDFISPEQSTKELTVCYYAVSLSSSDVGADNIKFTRLRVVSKSQDITLASSDFVIHTIARPEIRSLQKEAEEST